MAEIPKLKLLVDLDHTLIHSTWINPFPFRNSLPPRDIVHLKNCNYHAKLRPYTYEFLESMANHYEMTAVALAKRNYVEDVVLILDPDQKFFGGRLISQQELGRKNSKTANLSTLFPEGFKLTAIIDDRVDVWDNWKNVAQIKPYQYFTDGEEDLALMHMERVLIEAHNRFHDHFRNTGVMLDMSDIIWNWRTDVCQGVTVVLAGFTTEMAKYFTARLKNFGATVAGKVTNETSVVVATWGMPMVMLVDAESFGIPVVTSAWIEEIMTKWKRPDYAKFLLSNRPRPRIPRTQVRRATENGVWNSLRSIATRATTFLMTKKRD